MRPQTYRREDRTWALLALVGVLAFGTAACQSYDDDTGQPDGGTQEQPQDDGDY